MKDKAIAPPVSPETIRYQWETMRGQLNSPLERRVTRSPVALLDGFFLLRPTLIFPLWTMVLAGYRLIADPSPLGLNRWILLATSLTALFGLVYLLNQMRDREGDQQNQKSPLVALDLVSRRLQVVMAVVLGVLSPIFLIASGFGHLGLWMVATFALAGFLYNYTPIALEKTPWGGIVSGSVGGWLLLRLGAAVAGGEASFIAELPYVLSFTAGCLLTALPDLHGDKLTGKQTFAVTYGERATMVTAALMIIAAGSIGGFRGDLVIVFPALIGSILIIFSLARKTSSFAVIGNKLAILGLSAGVGIIYPVYLVIAVLYFPLARWYHRARFGLSYPNLSADSPQES